MLSSFLYSSYLVNNSNALLANHHLIIMIIEPDQLVSMTLQVLMAEAPLAGTTITVLVVLVMDMEIPTLGEEQIITKVVTVNTGNLEQVVEILDSLAMEVKAFLETMVDMVILALEDLVDLVTLALEDLVDLVTLALEDLVTREEVILDTLALGVLGILALEALDKVLAILETVDLASLEELLEAIRLTLMTHMGRLLRGHKMR